MALKEILLALPFLNPNIPPAQLEGIQGVVFHQPGEERPPDQFHSDEFIDAGYCRETGLIHLYTAHSRELMEQIMTHEIGHHVCYENENPDLPAIFGKGERSSLTARSFDFFSPRAEKSPREDCAETYRAFHESNFCQPYVAKTRVMVAKCLQIKKWDQKARSNLR